MIQLNAQVAWCIRDRSKMYIMARILTAVCREPFRLFFPLGVMAGTIGIGQWALFAWGLIPSYTVFFHSSIQTMVYMNCFIIGFLMTALPRFTQTFIARWWEIVTPLGLFIGIVLFLERDEWVLAECILLGLYGFLLYFSLCRVFGRSLSAFRGNLPVELIWVLIALLHGIIGTSVFILGQTQIWPAWVLKVGKPMMDQGFLVCLVMGMGGFLIPRLMGTYDQILRPGKLRYYLACAFLFSISFFIEGFGFENFAYGLRAAIVTAVFSKSNVFGKMPKDTGLYVWLAWVSVWMVAVGYWGASLFIKYRVEMLHITFIGGFSLMTFAISSMVIMSHAGEGQKLNRGIWVLPAVAAGIFLTLMNRLAVGVFPDLYFQILGWAAVIWISSAWIWLAFMLPRILRLPDEDEFRKMHEQVKSHHNLKEGC